MIRISDPFPCSAYNKVTKRCYKETTYILFPISWKSDFSAANILSGCLNECILAVLPTNLKLYILNKDAYFFRAIFVHVHFRKCTHVSWEHVYFLPPSQSQVSLREVPARKRNLTPTHSLNVCQPVGVEKMANNLYNVWLDIALVKTFLLIVSNWLVASLFPFFSSGNCYSGRSPLLLTSRYECATTIIIIIAIIIIIIYITVTIFFTLHHVTSWSGAQSS